MRLDTRASWATPVRSLLAFLAFGVVTQSCDGSTSPTHGPAASMVKVAGDAVSANAGVDVTPAPAVRITDAEDRPVPGIAVTFAIVAGSGVVTGAVVETDRQGTATVGRWTLGVLGENRMRATTSELGAVTFSAMALCPSSGALTLGGEVSGALASSDCRADGGFFTDWYTFTQPQAGAVLFTQQSGTVDSYLELVNADGQTIAYHDDVSLGVDLTAGLRVLVPAGTYRVAASSARSNEVGPYTLSARVASTTLTGCDLLFLVPGVSADQELENDDCPTTGPVFYEEAFGVWLRAGRSYSISMSSETFNTHLALWRGSPVGLQFVSDNDDVDGTQNSRIVVTPTQSGYFLIVASSGAAESGGAYRLTIE